MSRVVRDVRPTTAQWRRRGARNTPVSVRMAARWACLVLLLSLIVIFCVRLISQMPVDCGYVAAATWWEPPDELLNSAPVAFARVDLELVTAKLRDAGARPLRVVGSRGLSVVDKLEDLHLAQLPAKPVDSSLWDLLRSDALIVWLSAATVSLEQDRDGTTAGPFLLDRGGKLAAAGSENTKSFDCGVALKEICQFQAPVKLVVIDDGGAGADPIGPRSNSFLQRITERVEELNDPTLHVLMARAPGAPTQPFSPLNCSSFGKAVADALAGDCDGCLEIDPAADGDVSVGELLAFVYDSCHYSDDKMRPVYLHCQEKPDQRAILLRVQRPQPAWKWWATGWWDWMWQRQPVSSPTVPAAMSYQGNAPTDAALPGISGTSVAPPPTTTVTSTPVPAGGAPIAPPQAPTASLSLDRSSETATSSSVSPQVHPAAGTPSTARDVSATPKRQIQPLSDAGTAGQSTIQSDEVTARRQLRTKIIEAWSVRDTWESREKHPWSPLDYDPRKWRQLTEQLRELEARSIIAAPVHDTADPSVSKSYHEGLMKKVQEVEEDLERLAADTKIYAESRHFWNMDKLDEYCKRAVPDVKRDEWLQTGKVFCDLVDRCYRVPDWVRMYWCQPKAESDMDRLSSYVARDGEKDAAIDELIRKMATITSETGNSLDDIMKDRLNSLLADWKNKESGPLSLCQIQEGIGPREAQWLLCTPLARANVRERCLDVLAPLTDPLNINAATAISYSRTKPAAAEQLFNERLEELMPLKPELVGRLKFPFPQHTDAWKAWDNIARRFNKGEELGGPPGGPKAGLSLLGTFSRTELRATTSKTITPLSFPYDRPQMPPREFGKVKIWEERSAADRRLIESSLALEPGKPIKLTVHAEYSIDQDIDAKLVLRIAPRCQDVRVLRSAGPTTASLDPSGNRVEEVNEEVVEVPWKLDKMRLSDSKSFEIELLRPQDRQSDSVTLEASLKIPVSEIPPLSADAAKPLASDDRLLKATVKLILPLRDRLRLAVVEANGPMDSVGIASSEIFPLDNMDDQIEHGVRLKMFPGATTQFRFDLSCDSPQERKIQHRLYLIELPTPRWRDQIFSGRMLQREVREYFLFDAEGNTKRNPWLMTTDTKLSRSCRLPLETRLIPSPSPMPTPVLNAKASATDPDGKERPVNQGMLLEVLTDRNERFRWWIELEFLNPLDFVEVKIDPAMDIGNRVNAKVRIKNPALLPATDGKITLNCAVLHKNTFAGVRDDRGEFLRVPLEFKAQLQEEEELPVSWVLPDRVSREQIAIGVDIDGVGPRAIVVDTEGGDLKPRANVVTLEGKLRGGRNDGKPMPLTRCKNPEYGAFIVAKSAGRDNRPKDQPQQPEELLIEPTFDVFRKASTDGSERKPREEGKIELKATFKGDQGDRSKQETYYSDRKVTATGSIADGNLKVVTEFRDWEIGLPLDRQGQWEVDAWSSFPGAFPGTESQVGSGRSSIRVIVDGDAPDVEFEYPTGPKSKIPRKGRIQIKIKVRDNYSRPEDCVANVHIRVGPGNGQAGPANVMVKASFDGEHHVATIDTEQLPPPNVNPLGKLPTEAAYSLWCEASDEVGNMRRSSERLITVSERPQFINPPQPEPKAAGKGSGSIGR